MAAVLVPLTSHGMTLLNDSALDLVYSQAGISINPDVTLSIHVDVIAWGDEDGLEPGPYNPWGIDTGPGYIGVKDLRIENVRVRLRTDPNDHYGGYDAATMCKPMTIDVGTRTAGDTSQTFVRLAPGALQVTAEEAGFTVTLGSQP